MRYTSEVYSDERCRVEENIHGKKDHGNPVEVVAGASRDEDSEPFKEDRGLNEHDADGKNVGGHFKELY